MNCYTTETGLREKTSSWNVGRVIGKGISGEVRVATAKDDDSHQVAMKITDLNLLRRHFSSSGISEESLGHLALFEPQILRTFDHPNIIQLECSFVEESRYVISCLEYIDGNDLSCYVMRNDLSTKEIQGIFGQLCSAVSYCHSRMVVHGDLKCENILVQKHNHEISVKLIDFGFSQQLKFEEEKVQILGNTTEYSPPDQKLSFAWDSWSVGVILYVMVTHHLPFTNLLVDTPMKNPVEIAKKVDNEQIFEILVSLWKLEPNERMLIKDLNLKFPWLKGLETQQQLLQQQQQQQLLRKENTISSFSPQPYFLRTSTSLPLSSEYHEQNCISPLSQIPPNSFAPQNTTISFPPDLPERKETNFILFCSSERKSRETSPPTSPRSLKIKRETTQTGMQKLIRTDVSRERTREDVLEQVTPKQERKKKKKEKPRGKKRSPK